MRVAIGLEPHRRFLARDDESRHLEQTTVSKTRVIEAAHDEQ
jgi:hypothetical protein